MVQILPKVESAGSAFGKAIGGGVGKGFGDAISQGMENKAIKEQYGVDLSGVTSPEMRQQIMANELKYGRSLKQARASEDIDYSSGGQRQKLPGFMGQEEGQSDQSSPEQERKPSRNREEAQDFVERNKPKKEKFPEFPGRERAEIAEQGTKAFAHAPQTETQGKKYPILNPEQLMQEGSRIQKERNAAGFPTEFEEGVRIANIQNDEKRKYNQEVDADIAQQAASQEAYGKYGEEKLLKLFPEATDEHRALAKRYGEEASAKHKSEAAIHKEIAEKVKSLKNTVASIRSSIPAPRAFEKMKRHLLGTDRDWDKVKTDIRIKLKPLLDEGLYDTARNELSKLGYHPEERESIITDLGEGSRRVLTDFPKIYHSEKGKELIPQPGKEYYKESKYTPENLEKINQGISSALQAEPSANLILMRKGFEEKGVDWDVFKDNINDLVMNGGLKLNDEQLKQLDVLDNPPLDKLDKLLYGLNLIGR